MKQADYYKRYKVITEVGIGEGNNVINTSDSLVTYLEQCEVLIVYPDKLLLRYNSSNNECHIS